MKSILVVSADAGQSERLKAALTVQGWWVSEVVDRQQALRAAADQDPDLVAVDGDLPGAFDLVRSFATRNGGPGILLIRDAEDAWGAAELDVADAVLDKPVDAGRLVREAQRLLARPRTSVASDPADLDQRFSAEDIFGDILREVEGLGGGPPPPPARRPSTSPRPARPKPPVTELVPPPAVAGPEAAQGTDTRRFGQYELKERIGVGGMAEIWKARMTGVEGFEKTVAIKKILPHLTESEDFEKMFIEEAKLAARLNHENIIHIYDLGKINQQYFIAMEYVEGEDLRSILNAAARRKERIPLPLSMLIAARLASALDYAHRRPDAAGQEQAVVHRDVSPRNVLVGFDGRVKLCDFGVAKVASQVGRTQYGAIKGKIQYMSPEQAWGKPVDGRSDLFSLAVVLFEMVTGERLFAGDSEMSLLEAVRQCVTRSPRDVDPAIPKELSEIISRALSRDPDDRQQTAGELQRELEDLIYSMKPAPGAEDLATYLQALQSEPAPAVAVAPPPAPIETFDAEETLGPADDAAPEPRRWLRYGLWAAAAALAAALAVLGSLRLVNSQDPSAPAEPALAAPVAAPEPAPEETASAPPPEPAAALDASAQAPQPAAEEPETGLEDLVSRELARREAELRQVFRDEQERLQQEMEDLGETEPPPADEKKEGGGGLVP